MAEKQGEPKGQAPKDSQPQEGTTPPDQESGEPTGQEPGSAAEEGTGANESRLTSENAELRRENAKNRKAIGELQAAAKVRDEAGLSDADKTNRRIAELETQNKELSDQLLERAVRVAAMEAASKLGFRSPDVAYRLLDRGALEYHPETGDPKNVERLLKDVLAADPYLAKPSNGADFGGGQRGKTPSGAPTMNELIRKAAGG